MSTPGPSQRQQPSSSSSSSSSSSKQPQPSQQQPQPRYILGKEYYSNGKSTDKDGILKCTISSWDEQNVQCISVADGKSFVVPHEKIIVAKPKRMHKFKKIPSSFLESNARKLEIPTGA